MLRILVGIGHPADVHFFRFFIGEMENRGHEVLVAARDKEITCYLLDKYNIPYYLVSRHQKIIFRKILEYFVRWARTWRFCQRIKPDMAVGVGDFYLAQVGALSGFDTFLITDTEAARHDALLSFPFATYVLTPSCYQRRVRKQIRYNSYNELAYLSKKRFAPDPAIVAQLGITEDQRYVIARFTDRSAVHDIGSKGLSPKMKIAAVKEFSKYARVFISAEEALPDALQGYQIPCPPEKIHDAIYYADLLYGDSATMASEAACLGTPAIFVDDKGRGYTREQEEKYGLVFHFTTRPAEVARSVGKGIEILDKPEDRAEWRRKAEKMVGEKVEMTSFLVGEVLSFKWF